MADTPPPAPEGDALAGELALGLLDGAERAEALRLCLANPAFAWDAEAWSLRLSPLLHAIPPLEPPEHVWSAIEARTGGSAYVSAIHRARLWRGGALVSSAIAAGLALFITVGPPDFRQQAPMAVSQLAGSEGAASIAVAYDPRQGVLRLSPAALESGAKAPELWVIPADGVPRSLGLIRPDGRELAVDPDVARFLQGGVTLAITLEDPATAPHKAPSSAPVLTGKITII